MEINPNQELIIKHLSKAYYIKNNTFFEKPAKKKYGSNIVVSLSRIFYLDTEFCRVTFKFWAHSIGFPDDEGIWNISYTPTRLETTWSPEMAQDLHVFQGIDTEAELISMLSEEISKEIDAEILNTLVTSASTTQDFLGIMRCEGYKLTPMLYDPTSFTPKQYFVSMNYEEIKNERQTSIYWQNWLRARERH